jgi:hypothetical protein
VESYYEKIYYNNNWSEIEILVTYLNFLYQLLNYITFKNLNMYKLVALLAIATMTSAACTSPCENENQCCMEWTLYKTSKPDKTQDISYCASVVEAIGIQYVYNISGGDYYALNYYCADGTYGATYGYTTYYSC